MCNYFTNINLQKACIISSNVIVFLCKYFHFILVENFFFCWKVLNTNIKNHRFQNSFSRMQICWFLKWKSINMLTVTCCYLDFYIQYIIRFISNTNYFHVHILTYLHIMKQELYIFLIFNTVLYETIMVLSQAEATRHIWKLVWFEGLGTKNIRWTWNILWCQKLRKLAEGMMKTCWKAPEPT